LFRTSRTVGRALARNRQLRRSLLPSSHCGSIPMWKPNATRQARRAAGAQRTLSTVAWTRLFGLDAASKTQKPDSSESGTPRFIPRGCGYTTLVLLSLLFWLPRLYNAEAIYGITPVG
jgi:hypothetical protein